MRTARRQGPIWGPKPAHSGPEIAQELVLSPATVNTHFKKIHAKLDVQTRAGAVAKAMRLGMID